MPENIPGKRNSTLKKFLHQNRVFLFLHLVFLIVGGILIAFYEKGDEILYFNSLHTSFFNEFFKWITRLGESPALFFILLVAVFMGYGRGLLLSLNALLVFAAVQLFKRVLFADQVRPAAFFEGKAPLDFVQGVEVFRDHSFPSGHTAAAFALFFMLNILIKDKRWSPVFFILALLVGISRVYLLQHFLRDVYFGSLLGVLITAAFYLSFGQSDFYKNLSWKDKKLLK